MTVTDWLIDKSALVRLSQSPDAEDWANRIERGLVRIATVTRLEIGLDEEFELIARLKVREANVCAFDAATRVLPPPIARDLWVSVGVHLSHQGGEWPSASMGGHPDPRPSSIVQDRPKATGTTLPTTAHKAWHTTPEAVSGSLRKPPLTCAFTL